MMWMFKCKNIGKWNWTKYIWNRIIPHLVWWFSECSGGRKYMRRSTDAWGKRRKWEKVEEEVAKIDHLDVAAVPKTTNGAVVRKTHVVARLVSRVRLKSKKWELDQLDKVSKKERQLQPINAIMAHTPQRFEEFLLVVLNRRPHI